MTDEDDSEATGNGQVDQMINDYYNVHERAVKLLYGTCPAMLTLQMVVTSRLSRLIIGSISEYNLSPTADNISS